MSGRGPDAGGWAVVLDDGAAGDTLEVVAMVGLVLEGITEAGAGAGDGALLAVRRCCSARADLSFFRCTLAKDDKLASASKT